MGVIFTDMDTAVREHPEIVQKYISTIIPINDNKLSALNSAVWSGGSFIYVPPGVKVDIPLQAYFRINAENAGQFERTLIIADEGSYVHYIEGCTAPTYSSNSLHSAVVELIAHPHARLTYTTIQNWSSNVYNLVTKRAVAEENSVVVKDLETFDGFLRRLDQAGAQRVLVAEARLRPLTNPVRGMNGCAVVILNPPTGAEAAAREVCGWVAETLGETGARADVWFT